MSEVVMSRLCETGVVAILRNVPSANVMNVAEALYNGGVRLLEITLNSPGVYEAIDNVIAEFGGNMCVGAGTVLTLEDANKVIDHGVDFIVTPHTSKEVITAGVHANVPVMAGAMTPTEIFEAHRYGSSVVKVFPSGTLGEQYFREVRGPLSHIPLLAVGGVNLSNANGFLKSGVIGFGLGNSLVNKQAIQDGDFQQIEETAASFTRIYKEHAGGN